MADKTSWTQQSRSPSPPKWSPISNDASHTTLAEDLEATPVDLPPNVPISESTNTDIIALRAALEVLQMQRMQSERNIQSLSKQRDLALAHPEEFRQALVDGTIKSARELDTVFDEEQSQGEQTQVDDQTSSPSSPLRDFGDIPAALQIVRCPPVNWAKYHIVGEVLDQLHEQQRRVPDSGHISQTLPMRPHTIAAPYSPWHDVLTDPPKSKEPKDP